MHPGELESRLRALHDLVEPATYVVSVAVIFLELALLRAVRHPVSHRSGATSLVSGAFSFGLMGPFQRIVFASVGLWFWEHRLFTAGVGPLAWLGCFVVYDFAFYVRHRAAHEVRLLWCMHTVHHSTEEMRLASAVRGSVFDFVSGPWFVVWIPLLGFHPLMVIVVESISRIWGVLQHVSPRLVGKLGVLDRILVTPSVHRVHHGKELAYLDSNYGEVLTLWDHLFGTFEPEAQEPTYGLIGEERPDALFHIHLSPFRKLWHDLRRAPDLTSRLRYLFDAPGWSHDGPDRRVKALRRQAGQPSPELESPPT